VQVQDKGCSFIYFFLEKKRPLTLWIHVNLRHNLAVPVLHAIFALPIRNHRPWTPRTPWAPHVGARRPARLSLLTVKTSHSERQATGAGSHHLRAREPVTPASGDRPFAIGRPKHSQAGPTPTTWTHMAAARVPRTDSSGNTAQSTKAGSTRARYRIQRKKIQKGKKRKNPVETTRRAATPGRPARPHGLLLRRRRLRRRSPLGDPLPSSIPAEPPSGRAPARGPRCGRGWRAWTI
jgi:hypothetical protein